MMIAFVILGLILGIIGALWITQPRPPAVSRRMSPPEPIQLVSRSSVSGIVTMNCSQCGSPFESGDAYCDECGKPLGPALRKTLPLARGGRRPDRGA